MNAGSWYDAAHHPLSITGTTDASFTSWAGVVRGTLDSGSVIRAAAYFPSEWVRPHIKVKETFALYEVLRLLVETRPDILRASTFTIKIGNKVIFYTVQTRS